MIRPNCAEQFVKLLTHAQTSLHAYILSLLVDPTAADDVLQEVNVTLWRKAGDFDVSQSQDAFLAWACKVAYFKVLTFRRTCGRDRLVFDDQVLDRLAHRLSERRDELDPRRSALRLCLEKLPPNQHQLIQQRYASDGSVQGVAESLGRPVGSISQTLYRIRATLLDCIRRTLAMENPS